MGEHERLPSAKVAVAADKPAAGVSWPQAVRRSPSLEAGRVLALQRTVGNAAVRRLLRTVGWPGTSATSPNHGKTTPVAGVDRYPLYDAGLGGSRDPAASRDTREASGNRVVVFVPTAIDQSRPAAVLLHFHGLSNIGYRLNAGTGKVRDEDETRDRSDVQFAESIAEGDRQMLVVMPQGDLAAGFGNATTSPTAYVNRTLDLLKADTGIALTSAELIAGGWSAGGNRVSEMATAEATSGVHTLDSVVLFEGVNNFQSEAEVPDPAHAGQTMKVRREPLAGRDKLDIFLNLIARNLKANVAAIGVLSASATTRYLASSFRFIAYYGDMGLYAPVHEMLDQGIRLMFGEPLTSAEDATQKRRLQGGLQLARNVPDSAGLDSAIAALPAGVRDELRKHYQVIRVTQHGDPARHAAGLDDAAGRLHSLGHENIVGSGALLDALRRTRPVRPVTPPRPATMGGTTGALEVPQDDPFQPVTG
ncbi:MAG TPA: hypothetical protein VII98_08625 [Solirubrobacteraceae bacterium]